MLIIYFSNKLFKCIIAKVNFWEGSFLMTKDLTVGKVESVLIKFCLPLFGSIIFQQLYNIADSLIAGKFIGENALAAVGNAYEITLIFIAFAFGINIGCSVITSRLFGSGELGKMKTAVYTTLVSSAAVLLILMLGGFLFGKSLLHLINTPSEIFDDSLLYLNIYILGLPFLFYYNISTGIFSALGDSQTPFIFLAFSSTSNVLMDILFVKVFKMGVAGVAWATFLCQGVACVLSVITVFMRFKKIKTDEKSQIFSLPIFLMIASVAVPSILQQSFVSFGNIAIQSLINSFGSVATAGYSAAIKLNNLVITSFNTLGSGMSNFTAQNLGAGKYDRVNKGFFAGAKLVWCLCVPICLLYFPAAEKLVFIFMNDAGSSAIKIGAQMLKIISPFYFVVSVKIVSDGILRGAGLMKKFMVTTFTDLVLRVALAFILSKNLGIVGIWYAWPIGWIIGTVISVFLFVKSFPQKSLNIKKQA